MSSYLTPSKISFLALASVYCDSVVPAKAIIPILSVLSSQVLPESTHYDDDLAEDALSDGKFALADIEKIIISHPSAIPGRSVWDLLLNKIWSISSSDALQTFFANLSTLLQIPGKNPFADAQEDASRIRFSTTSPLGTFIRKSQLEFSRLLFHDSVTLWQKFVLFRQPTRSQWLRRNIHIEQREEALEGFLDSAQDITSKANPYSLRISPQSDDATAPALEDADRLLEHQVNMLQKTGTRIPASILQRLREMLDTQSLTPSLSFYVQFLEAWKKGDYPCSFENLHRYFDYTMHHKEQNFYQYALLNLAALHADFGALTEAVVAIKETIQTAREHCDLACLNYSLSWLYHFCNLHTKDFESQQPIRVSGNDKAALNFLKAKAKETNMWGLFNTATLSEVKLVLRSGYDPLQSFEGLIKVSQVSLTKSIRGMTTNHTNLVSAAFSRIGVSCQAWLSLSLSSCCYGHSSPAEVHIQTISQEAFLHAREGRYDRALCHMETVDQQALRTLKYHRFWHEQMGLLRLRKSLQSDDLETAARFLTHLRSKKLSAQEISHQLSVLEVEFLIGQKNFAGALKLLEDLAARSDRGANDVSMHVRILCLKARIYNKAGISPKAFSLAIRATFIAFSTKTLPCLWEAVEELCVTLQSLGEYQASRQMIDKSMPHVLECGDSHQPARLHLLLADAHVGLAGVVMGQRMRQREHLSRALENLDRAHYYFTRCDNVGGQCETLAKKATIMHLNGDALLANDCAAQYLSVKKRAHELLFSGQHTA